MENSWPFQWYQLIPWDGERHACQVTTSPQRDTQLEEGEHQERGSQDEDLAIPLTGGFVGKLCRPAPDTVEGAGSISSFSF